MFDVTDHLDELRSWSTGNPNQPDGLRMVHLNDLTAEQAEQLGLPPPRAGPAAA